MFLTRLVERRGAGKNEMSMGTLVPIRAKNHRRFGWALWLWLVFLAVQLQAPAKGLVKPPYLGAPQAAGNGL